jgi:hypothetical protein
MAFARRRLAEWKTSFAQRAAWAIHNFNLDILQMLNEPAQDGWELAAGLDCEERTDYIFKRPTS